MAATQKFWFDDPTFPDLVGEVAVPQASPLPLTVQGFSGGGFALGSQQGQAAGVHIGMINALDYIRDKTKNPLQRWAATANLQVMPWAGVDFNAYYDRNSIRLFYKSDPTRNKTMYTNEGTGVYVHELGHAVLDAIRPDFWSIPVLEISAFHESFGDCFFLLTLLTYDAVIEWGLKETRGNLRQSHVFSQVAVDLGTAIYRKPTPLRDAFNHFTWVAPETLPANTPDDRLSQEPHNYSRLWTGTFYDMLCAIYDKLRSEGWDGMSALKNSRDICARYLMNGTAIAANTPRFCDALARAILAVDAGNGSVYQALLTEVFNRRKVLLTQTRMSAAPEVPVGDIQTSDRVEALKALRRVLAFRVKRRLAMRLSDSKMVLPSDGNPLYNVEVEMPVDRFFQFNDRGRLMEEIEPDMPRVLQAVLKALQFLHNRNQVGTGRPWAVRDGKLVRQHSCNEGSYVNNSLVKGAPEYGKPWKPQNNAGCCGTCKPKPHEPPKVPKLGCFVRTQGGQVSHTRTGNLVRTKAC